MTSPDYVNEFDETLEERIKSDFPIKKQKKENVDCNYDHINHEMGNIRRHFLLPLSAQSGKFDIFNFLELHNNHQTSTPNFTTSSECHGDIVSSRTDNASQIVPDVDIQENLIPQSMKNPHCTVPSVLDDIMVNNSHESGRGIEFDEAVKENSYITPISDNQGIPLYFHQLLCPLQTRTKVA